ncbi:MAG: phage terminase large subunit, partial [Staphylococcus equorum]|nr:phage terminase large subunit [Staphylococcus equorum]
PRAMAKLIEDKANGPAVIATLKREVNGIIPVNPQGSKVARAQAVTPVIESGNVFLPKHKEFSYDLIEEAAAFPNGKHDDAVDSLSQALSRMANKRQAGISSTNIW